MCANIREAASLRSVPILIAIVLLAPTLLAATPSASASNHEVTVCGRVVNAAGWPLAGIHVNATPADHFSGIDFILGGSGTRLDATTDADGAFELRLLKASYTLAFSDPAVRPSAERYGALYAPQALGVSLAGRATTPDACAGEAGFRVGGDGVTLASPGQAFLQLTVTDGAAEGTPGLAFVDVQPAPIVDEKDLADPASLPTTVDGRWLHLHTDASGVARMACPASAPMRLLLDRGGYVDALHTTSCPASGAADTSLPMWRRFVELRVYVNDSEGVAVNGATVGVAASPDGMQAFAPGDAACGGTTSTNHVLIDNGASPYVCQAATAGGFAKLRLPWIDGSGAAVYGLAASKDGFVTLGTDVAVARGETAPGMPPAVPIKTAEIGLAPQTATVTGGPIEDVNGTIVGASVQFQPGLVATTVAGGMFTIEVPTGAHTLTITAEGKQTRTCTVTVARDEDGAGILTLTDARADCYRLTSAGKALVAATIRDRYTLAPAVAGVEVCTAGGGHCNYTNADGLTLIEMASGEALSIPSGPLALWTFDGMPAATFNIGGFTAGALYAKTFDIPRANRTVELLVQKDTATPLDNATIRVDGPLHQTVPEDQATYSNVTGATGQLTIPLRWTSMPGHSEFDLASFVITARRHNTSEHFDLTASAPVNVSSAETTHDVVITMDPEGVVDMAVTVTDAHTGAPLDGAVVTATLVPAAATDTCGPVCTAASPAGLQLHASHHYTVCVMMPGYEIASGATCATDITPGPALAFALKRNTSVIAVTVTDPHTGLPIQGAKVHAEAADGFTCAPTGMSGTHCATAATTSAVGKATITLPWHSVEELCIVTDAGTLKAVVTASGTLSLVTEDVAFQPSEKCPGLAAGASGETLALRPLRAAVDITGTLVGALNDEPVEGATVAPSFVDPTLGDLRPGFVCDPTDHDTPDAAFPACAGIDASSGTVSLTLPAGHVSQRHLWTLRVDAPAHFEDVYTLVQAPRNVELTLYPEAFEVQVLIEDSDGLSTHACQGGMLVFFRDLESDQTYPAQLAQPQEGAATCIAKFDVPTWSRSAPARPIEAADWPKSGSEFAVVAADGLHLGATVARLGPGDNVTTLRVLHASTTGPSAGSHVIHGTVRDADMIVPAGEDAPTNGIAGARVVATRAEGACADTGRNDFEGVTGAGGLFGVLVDCAGTYDLTLTAGRYVDGSVTGIVVAGNALVTDAGAMGLERVHRRDYLLVRDLVDSRGIGGASISVRGVDVVWEAPSVAADGTGALAFDLPWGTYEFTVTAPADDPGYVAVPGTTTASILAPEDCDTVPCRDYVVYMLRVASA